MKRFLKSIGHILGFEKLSKNVKDDINAFNLRSIMFMGAVIVALEIWLIIRQSTTYIVPKWGTMDGFDLIFRYLSKYVLFLVVGIAIFFYSFTLNYKEKMSEKTRLIMNYIAPGVAIVYSFFLFKENLSNWSTAPQIFSTTLLILLYASAFGCMVFIVIYNTFQYLKKKESKRLSMGIIIFFALMCLVFGIYVSFSDHYRDVATKQNEIICFLTMAIFVSCMLIYRPWISIVTNILMFGFFYIVIILSDKSLTDPVVHFTDGDKINYATFFIGLTTVSVMSYHHRLQSATISQTLRINAEFDELTGLKNIYTFNNELSNVLAITTNARLQEKIVLFFDVHNFKTFNDQRGFNKGNEFLKDLGRMLERAFKEDVVARDTGDKFVVLTEVNGFKEKIERVRQQAIEYDKEIKPNIRVGGYILNNPNEDVRRVVDKARYACGTISDRLDIYYAEYDKKMHDDYHFSQYIIHNLDNAIENGYIKPYYQPIMSAKSGKLYYFEALARWIDPTKGYISPGRFIPTLEKSKLIHKLDAYIAEKTVKDMIEDYQYGFPKIPVSINMSRLDFELMDVPDLLNKICTRYGLDKELLHVELTETALTDEDDALVDALMKLKENGYHIWLDDFGSGYSSFNVLQHYDFEVLKLDMKFISNIDNPKSKTIIKSIINMCKELKITTLSEGVETEAEKDFLVKNGCEYLQGYLFSKPVSADDIRESMGSRKILVDEKYNY